MAEPLRLVAGGASNRGSEGHVTDVDWNVIFAWVGRIGTLVGLAGGAFIWFGRTYIDRWLARHFQGQLDALKHTQAQEIERLRAKIAGMLDRATKLHQHEFEVLPLIWDKLSASMGSAVGAVNPIQTYQDVSRMESEEMEAVLDQSDFAEHEKAKIRAAAFKDRSDIYTKLIDHYRLNKASSDRIDFHNAIIQHGIFVEPPLRAKMLELSLLLADAIRTHGFIMAPDYPLPRPHKENSEKVLVTGRKLMEEIQDMISGRLWNASKLDA